MKLKTIVTRLGWTPEKLLVPKNSGLKEYGSIALERLGVMRDGKLPDVFEIGNARIEVVQQRAESIPEVLDYMTRRRIPAAGLTGDDLFDEYMLNNPKSALRVLDTTDWQDPNAKYGRPALCFLGRRGDDFDFLTDNGDVVVNRKYERTSRIFLDELEDELKTRFPSVVIDGGIEEALVNGVGRYAIEQVYSGKSIEENNLKVLYIVRQSDVDLISSWNPTEGAAVATPTRPTTGSLEATMRREFGNIENRLRNPTGSETSRMLADKGYAARKLTEEAFELVEASLLGTGRVIPETADLIYRAFGICVQNAGTYEQLMQEMAGRQGVAV